MIEDAVSICIILEVPLCPNLSIARLRGVASWRFHPPSAVYERHLDVAASTSQQETWPFPVHQGQGTVVASAGICCKWYKSWMECWEYVGNTKVWIAFASYWKRRHHIKNFSCLLRLLPLPEPAGWSSWGNLHGRLCISGLISWVLSIVVRMRQIKRFDMIWLLKVLNLEVLGSGSKVGNKLQKGNQDIAFTTKLENKQRSI